MSVLRAIIGFIKPRAKTPEQAQDKAKALEDQRDFRLTKNHSRRDAVSAPDVFDPDL
jgi:hypothetical protein